MTGNVRGSRVHQSGDQHDRLLGLLRAGDPRQEVWFAWNAKEVVRQIYDHTDPELADGDPAWGVTRASGTEKTAFKMWSWIIGNRQAYELFLRAASLVQKFFPRKNGMLRRLPPPFSGWTRGRDIKPLAGESFISRWKKGDFR